MRTSGSLSRVPTANRAKPSSCPVHDRGDIPFEFDNHLSDIAPSPQRRCPGRTREADCIPPIKLPSSVSVPNSIASSSTMTTITARPVHCTIRRDDTRKSQRPSATITSSHSSSTVGHRAHERRHLPNSDLSCLPEARTGGSIKSSVRGFGITSSGSLASIVGPVRSRTRRKRRTPENVNPLCIRRSYTVFQKKLFRFKRQERILLLDKQWIHVLPSSTKTLNVMFDTRKSVSYHVRLLANAKVKSGGKNSVFTIGFKKGSKGRLKRYDLKAGNRSIAVEIVQFLWQMRAQFPGDNGSRSGGPTNTVTLKG